MVRGAVFDSSLTLAEAAAQGAGMALLPVEMFARELQQGRLAQPFAQELHRGAYWLTRLQSRPATGAMTAFRDWLLAQASAGAGAGAGQHGYRRQRREIGVILDGSASAYCANSYQ